MVKSQFAKGFGIFPARENAVHFTERVPFFYACHGTFNKGMEGKHNGISKAVLNGPILFTCDIKMVPNFTKPTYAEI